MIKDDGSWVTLLDTSECDTQHNYTMVVRADSPETGVVTVTISDIRIGEVWVCSGQSNMQFTVGQVRVIRDTLSCFEYIYIFVYLYQFLSILQE